MLQTNFEGRAHLSYLNVPFAISKSALTLTTSTTLLLSKSPTRSLNQSSRQHTSHKQPTVTCHLKRMCTTKRPKRHLPRRDRNVSLARAQHELGGWKAAQTGFAFAFISSISCRSVSQIKYVHGRYFTLSLFHTFAPDVSDRFNYNVHNHLILFEFRVHPLQMKAHGTAVRLLPVETAQLSEVKRERQKCNERENAKALTKEDNGE